MDGFLFFEETNNLVFRLLLKYHVPIQPRRPPSLPEVEAMRRSILYFSAPILGLFLWALGLSQAPGEIKAPETAKDLPGIVFVGAPIFDEKTDGGVGVYQGAYHWRDSYIYARSATYNRPERTMGPMRPGRNLHAA